MRDTTFAVTRFKNRNGTISWRVSGYLAGVRIRKNLRSREEAAVEKAALEAKAAQIASGARLATTFLTDDQLRGAEAAYRRLDDCPKSLEFYLDIALNNYREPECQMSLHDAVAEYLAKKEMEYQRTLLSFRQLRSIRNELGALQRYFPSGPVSQFNPEVLTTYLERGRPSLKTYNNRRGLLSTFFKFAFQKGWVLSNPVERIPHHRINHRRGSAVTLDAATAAKLMKHVECFENGILVPYFAICLFAGIRPCVRFGEISRLRPESVRLDIGTIHIEPEVSKVRMKRLVTIQPNLAAWLRAYPLEVHPIVPPNSMNTRPKIFKAFGLTHDVLRHTFISMFVGKFRSMGEAALQAGNSESIIRKHYLDLKTKEEAEAFFSIMPKLREARAGAPPVSAVTEPADDPFPTVPFAAAI